MFITWQTNSIRDSFPQTRSICAVGGGVLEEIFKIIVRIFQDHLELGSGSWQLEQERRLYCGEDFLVPGPKVPCPLCAHDSMCLFKRFTKDSKYLQVKNCLVSICNFIKESLASNFKRDIFTITTSLIN